MENRIVCPICGQPLIKSSKGDHIETCLFCGQYVTIVYYDDNIINMDKKYDNTVNNSNKFNQIVLDKPNTLYKAG